MNETQINLKSLVDKLKNGAMPTNYTILPLWLIDNTVYVIESLQERSEQLEEWRESYIALEKKHDELRIKLKDLEKLVGASRCPSDVKLIEILREENRIQNKCIADQHDTIAKLKEENLKLNISVARREEEWQEKYNRMVKLIARVVYSMTMDGYSLPPLIHSEVTEVLIKNNEKPR